jgi:hypothetical protein
MQEAGGVLGEIRDYLGITQEDFRELLRLHIKRGV